MYSRLIKPPSTKSFFLFGPRGTGKSFWARQSLPKSLYFDLLDSAQYTDLLASPRRLGDGIPASHRDWVVIDEIQKIPALLDEVHRLIETRRIKFAMTGSSARKLRRGGANLLAGRALTRYMHPLTASELGDDFDLKHSLRYGHLPAAYLEPDPAGFLKSYVATYLKEEILAEGLTRNISAFARFLEAASFSQGQILNISTVARDCGVERKVVESYFGILDDLLVGVRIPVFQRRSKRALVVHPKFYFFDPGVYRAIRPAGPLDQADEISGPALETLVLSHLRATNDALDLGYSTHYWRTRTGVEVDFVLYGERGLIAIEVKHASRLRSGDLDGLRAFRHDYPMAKAYCVYAGTRELHDAGVEVVGAARFLKDLPEVLGGR